MSKKTVYSDYRVVVRPRAAGDYGYASIGGVDHTPEEELALCREIEQEIIRHVDGTSSGYITIEYDTDDICEHCGWTWTEGNSPHNGGCCAIDCDVMESLQND